MAYFPFDSTKFPNPKLNFFYEDFDRPVFRRPKTSPSPFPISLLPPLPPPPPPPPPLLPQSKNLNLTPQVINRIEENYWANWKPKRPLILESNKNISSISRKPKINVDVRKTKVFIREGAKSAPPIKHNNNLKPHYLQKLHVNNDIIEHFVRDKAKPRVSQEVQTEATKISKLIGQTPSGSKDSQLSKCTTATTTTNVSGSKHSQSSSRTLGVSKDSQSSSRTSKDSRISKSLRQISRATSASIANRVSKPSTPKLHKIEAPKTPGSSKTFSKKKSVEGKREVKQEDSVRTIEQQKSDEASDERIHGRTTKEIDHGKTIKEHSSGQAVDEHNHGRINKEHNHSKTIEEHNRGNITEERHHVKTTKENNSGKTTDEHNPSKSSMVKNHRSDVKTPTNSKSNRSVHNKTPNNCKIPINMSKIEATVKTKVEIKESTIVQDDCKTQVEIDDEGDEVIPLKHCDSYIIHSIKHAEDQDKPRFEQPKCIRLFKKSASKVVRGGSYPLKTNNDDDSVHKQKANIRLGRPGSPIMVTRSHSHRTKF